MRELTEWDSFYVIVGSAAGALIGLQFVVMTLIAERPPLRAAEAGAAFATPTIVHFGTTLLATALCGIIGFGGAVYAVITARRLRKQAVYQPEFEDWLFHVLLPLAAYVILALSPFAALSYTRVALFAVAGAALLLLFIGIHNAWDAVSYHVFVNARDKDAESGRETISDRDLP